MDQSVGGNNSKLLLSPHIKRTEIMFILVLFGFHQVIVLFLFRLLTQMEKRNGILLMVMMIQSKHHFGLLIISLVSEEHEMIC